MRPPWATSGQTLGVQSQLGHRALGGRTVTRDGSLGGGFWLCAGKGQHLWESSKEEEAHGNLMPPPPPVWGRPGQALLGTGQRRPQPLPWEGRAPGRKKGHKTQEITRTALWRQQLGYLRGHGRVGLGRGGLRASRQGLQEGTVPRLMPGPHETGLGGSRPEEPTQPRPSGIRDGQGLGRGRGSCGPRAHLGPRCG